MTDSVTSRLEADSAAERLKNLSSLLHTGARPEVDVPFSDEVNNHVHTRYSFSPYSPSRAVWMARSSGLRAVGSVDHDSIGAAVETIEAGKILGIGTTVGFELRVSFAGTPLEARRINNPDSIGIAYMVIHGVPGPRINEAAEFLEPLQEERNRRNTVQVDRLNGILDGISAPRVAFGDVEAGSFARDGGSITERHILHVAARQLMDWLRPGPSLRRWIEDHVTGRLPETLVHHLDDPDNVHYVYDLLGALKSSFLPKFFVQPSAAECLPVADVVGFANEIGAIPAYAYLGDIADSPTADKKAAKFEDGYLDELFELLTDVGFRAVTYMPPRNTVRQLGTVQRLCADHDLMEISGVDINSSRQSFRCPEILMPEFHHLIDATWALIAHEKLASVDPALSLFADPDRPLASRIERYARLGRAIDPTRPEQAGDVLEQ